MHKLYRVTAIPHFGNSDGNHFGELKNQLVTWKGFYSEKAKESIRTRFYSEEQREHHKYNDLEFSEISPRDVAQMMAQYFTSKGEYKTSNSDTVQERLYEYLDFIDDARKGITEFIEAQTDAMAPPPFEHYSGMYDPDLHVDSDYVEEVLVEFDSLIHNHYEPYYSLAQLVDESEEEIESWEKVYIENGMLVTRNKLINDSDREARAGSDGIVRPYVFFTFEEFLCEYSDLVSEADLETFVSEYTDEVRYRKSLGYKIEDAAQFLQRWFGAYTPMELSDFPEEWRNAINDAHAIAAA